MSSSIAIIWLLILSHKLITGIIRLFYARAVWSETSGEPQALGQGEEGERMAMRVMIGQIQSVLSTFTLTFTSTSAFKFINVHFSNEGHDRSNTISFIISYLEFHQLPLSHSSTFTFLMRVMVGQIKSVSSTFTLTFVNFHFHFHQRLLF